MEVKKLPITNLVENKWNPNVLSETKLKILSENIQQGGMLQPILVRPIANGKYEIIDGFHRVKASKMAGLTEIMCVVVESSDEEAKLKTISFNHLRGFSDEVKMKELLDDLLKNYKEQDLSEQVGLSQIELDKYLGRKIDRPDLDFSNISDPKEIERILREKGFEPEKAKAMAEVYSYIPPKLEKSEITGEIKKDRIMIAFYYSNEEDAKLILEFFKQEKDNEPNPKKLLKLVKYVKSKEKA